jgi:hypothetical protein
MDILVMIVTLVGVLSWFVLFGILFYIIIRLNRFHTETTANFVNLSNSLNELHVQRILNSKPDMEDFNQIVFRTIDGQYKSDSIQGLFQQMLNDPNSTLTEEQKENLRNFFESMSGPDDDDDDSQEPWKKK